MRIAACLILLAASTAHAGGANEFNIGSSSRGLHSDSANAVTADSLGSGNLGVGRTLDLELVPGLQLSAIGNFAWGGADGEMFQTMSTELDTLSLTVGGRARYPLRTRYIVATARLDIGMARAAVAIRDDADHTASDSGWGATSTAAAGLELYAVSTTKFKLGIRFELGYTATSNVELVATPETGSEGTLQLAMTAASLGSLDLSGSFLGFSVVSQF
ncbi:MAG: hypothetical protein HOV81_02385 [Kofleriaceae bacterium]|nr:hypothetical protein [Kofleriaceae bacterium]